jgi:hypothetical protein
MAHVTEGADCEAFGRCCYTGVDSLVKASFLGRRTVRRAIDELVEAGLLLVEGGLGRGVKQAYTLVGAEPYEEQEPARKSGPKRSKSGPECSEKWPKSHVVQEGCSSTRSTDGSACDAPPAEPPVEPTLQEQPQRPATPRPEDPTPPVADVPAWEVLLPRAKFNLWGSAARQVYREVCDTLTTHGAVERFKQLYAEEAARGRKRTGGVFFERLPGLAQQAAAAIAAEHVADAMPYAYDVMVAEEARLERRRLEREARRAQERTVAHA